MRFTVPTVGIALGLLWVAVPVGAQTALTANTLTLDDPDAPGHATLEDLAWLVGSWRGEAFGGQIEEMWTPPSAGTMMGAFKLVNDGRVSFYEFLVFQQEDETVSLKLKHFHADLVGWEEPDDYVTFPLVRAEDDALYFRGLTFRRAGRDALHIYLSLTRDGERREESMTLRRRQAAGSAGRRP